MKSVETDLLELDYLGLWRKENLDLKIYRAQISGSEVPNGSMIRQTEYLVDQLKLYGNRGFVIMLKGIDYNYIFIGLVGLESKFEEYCYKLTPIENFEIVAVLPEIFLSFPKLKALVDYEKSLINYIKTSGEYLKYTF